MLAKPSIVRTPDGYLHLEWHTPRADLVLKIWGASYDYCFHHDGIDIEEAGEIVAARDANGLWPYILSIGDEQ